MFVVIYSDGYNNKQLHSSKYRLCPTLSEFDRYRIKIYQSYQTQYFIFSLSRILNSDK